MKRVSVLALLVLLPGCVHFGEAFRHVDSTVLSDAHSATPQEAQNVAVYLGGDAIPAGCERVGLVRAVASVAVVQNLREEAGRLGANAVDLRDLRTESGARSALVADSYWDALALYCPSA
jgi:hypothetical protein